MTGPLVLVVGAESGDSEEVLTKGVMVGRWDRGQREEKGGGEALEWCQSSLGQDMTPSHGPLTPSIESIKILGVRRIPKRKERG